MATAPREAVGISRHATDPGARLAQLDGLRSMVILVLIVHFSDSVFDSAGEVHGWFTPAYMAIWYSAAAGMEMFFVLSGFLITGLLLDSKGSPSYFRTFYARRFLRIFPLYYGVLALYLVALPGWFPERFRVLAEPAGQQFSYWLYLVNLAPLAGWDLAPGTAHFWSLAVEEQFYLLWPLVVFACSASTLKKICVACIGVAIASRFTLAATSGDPSAINQVTLSQLDALGIGGWLAVHRRERRTMHPFSAWIRPAACAAVAAVVLVLLAGPASGRLSVPVYGTAAVWLGASLVIRSIDAAPGGRWHRGLMSRPLQALGRYSYGIYVLHEPLMVVFDRTGLLLDPGGRYAADPLKALTYTVVAVPICVLAGALSWHLFEEPILRLKRYFPYDRGDRVSAASHDSWIRRARLRRVAGARELAIEGTSEEDRAAGLDRGNRTA